VDDPAVHERQHGPDLADPLNRHIHQCVIRHRKVRRLSDFKGASLVIVTHEPPAWSGEAFFVLFMRILLSERRLHPWLALI